MYKAAGVVVPLLGRVLAFGGTVIGASVLVHLLLAIVPGDAIDTLPNGDALRPMLAAAWDLDQPLVSRIGRAMLRALSGDLGTSLTTKPGAKVSTLIAAAAPQSLLLIFFATGGSVVAALASVRLSRPTPAARAVIAVLSAMPTALATMIAVSAINAITFRMVEQGIIARPVWFALPLQDSPVRTALAVSLLIVGSSQLAALAGRVDEAWISVSNAAFVTAERARAGDVSAVVARHLLVPVVRAVAAGLPTLLSGLVVVERGLGLGGCGALFWNAARERDWPLAAGLAASAAVVVAGARLLADAVAIASDPRERADT